MKAVNPVHWDEAIGAWIVTSYAVAEAVLKDWNTFTVDNPRFSTAQAIGRSMVSRDGADHIRLRKPFVKAFHKNTVAKVFTNFVAGQCVRLIEVVRENECMDLRAEYCGPLTANAIIFALGLEGVDDRQIRGYVAEIDEGIGGITAGQIDEFPQMDAVARLREAVRESFSREPKPPFFWFIQDGNISESEAVSEGAFFALAGIDTTEAAISSAFYHILRTPASLAAVRENPDLVPGLVEEALRLEPPGAMIERYARHNTLLCGAAISAGDMVLVSVVDANRDPDVFSDPEKFDMHRLNISQHLSFAAGRHYCLGIYLARLEAEIAIKTLVEALPAIRIDLDRSLGPRGLVYRCPEAIHVFW